MTVDTYNRLDLSLQESNQCLLNDRCCELQREREPIKASMTDETNFQVESNLYHQEAESWLLESGQDRLGV